MSDSDTDPPSSDDLRQENDQLRAKLREYKKLEEDLMAERVFNSARKRLFNWITINGLVIVIAGLVGVRELYNLATDAVSRELKDKLPTLVDKEIPAQVDRRIEVALTEQKITEIVIAQANKSVNQRVNQIGVPLTGAAQPSIAAAPSAAPSVDYTANMNPVRNQGMEGSVVGFAVAATQEYQIYKSSKRRVVISPRYIYYLARASEGSTATDSGAVISDAVKAVRENGSVTEDVWPYVAGQFASAPPAKVAAARKYKIANVQPLKNLSDVKAALLKTGPVVAGITVYSSFFSTKKTGLVSDPKPNEAIMGGQAICVVGFDDSSQRLKFKNSYGPTWGDNGYGYISYNYANQFLSDSWAIWN